MPLSETMLEHAFSPVQYCIVSKIELDVSMLMQPLRVF
jgi:hypothetical protein